MKNKEIELVIKIDEDEYKARQRCFANPKRTMIHPVDKAIANGTVLPKGYGKYDELKEAVEKIKEDIENMKVVGYACDPEGFVEDEIVSKTDVEDIIDKYTEGLL